MTIPFSVIPKTSFDKIKDRLLFIPGYLSRIHDFWIVNHYRPSRSDAESLLQSIDWLDNELEAWLAEFKEEMVGEDSLEWLFFDMEDARIDEKGDYHPIKRVYREDAIAECLGHYDLGQFLLIVLRIMFCDASEFPSYESQARARSISVLATVGYADLLVQQGTLYIYFGYAFFLQILLLACPDDAQRTYATKTLIRWASPDPPVPLDPQPSRFLPEWHPLWHFIRKLWNRSVKLPVFRPVDD